MLRGKSVAHHVADVVSDEVRPVDPEPVEKARHVLALRFLVVAACGMGRQAHAAQIGHDDRSAGDEGGGQRRPHVAGVAETMQHDDRRSLAGYPGVDRGAVGFDLLDAHAGWERLHHELYSLGL